MKLGIVTYNIAASWDVDTLIAVCTDVGLAGVELRTTHGHGVELELTAAQRREVAAKFADSASTQSLAEATAPKVVLIGVPFEVSLPASPNLASGTDLTLHLGDQTFLAEWQED